MIVHKALTQAFDYYLTTIFLLWLVRGFTGGLGVSATPTFLRFPTVRDQPALMQEPERLGFDTVFIGEVS